MATEVAAFQQSRELAGFFQIVATAAPGHTLDELEAVIVDEIARLADEGPTADELARVKAQAEAQFVYRLQTVGGFGGKSDQLNAYNVFVGDPAFFERDLARYLAVTPRSRRCRDRAVPAVAGPRVGERRPVRPPVAGAGRFRARGGALTWPIARACPSATADAPFVFPTIHKSQLANGLAVWSVSHTAPCRWRRWCCWCGPARRPTRRSAPDWPRSPATCSTRAPAIATRSRSTRRWRASARSSTPRSVPTRRSSR